MAVIPMSSPRGQTCKNVGGGTWCYGWVPDGASKKCYSNYINSTKKHHATTVMASVNEKWYADPGVWANSALKGGWAYTCYAYWGND